MAKKKLSDAEAKAILKKWPNRTRSVWPAPNGHGYWICAQPRLGKAPGPTLSAPGADLFKTQPDGLWIYAADRDYCDIVAIEVCGTIQNLNDKRSRYFPSSHSLILTATKRWLDEEISIQKGGRAPRWDAVRTFGKEPDADMKIPVRHLRVMYALPNDAYEAWAKQHSPTGYEFFCPHSSLDSYRSPKMQRFLGQMSIANQFYTKLKR
jgi:hypothetical protein